MTCKKTDRGIDGEVKKALRREAALLNYSCGVPDWPEGDDGLFGLSSGAALSCGSGLSACDFVLSSGSVSSAHCLGFMARVMSRGGVILGGGRKYAAVAALTTVIGLAGQTGWAADIEVSSGSTSTGITLGDSEVNSTMLVSFGGSAISTFISSGGSQGVEGLAFFTYIYDGGVQTASSGGSAWYTYISSGGSQGMEGRADTTYISGGGVQTVSSGGSALGTYISSGGSQGVEGQADETHIYADGVQTVSSGGSANTTVIFSGGSQGVEGLAQITSIYAGGVQTVSSGGSAVLTSISSGGSQVVEGWASGTEIFDSGVQTVSSGGSAVLTSISSGGSQVVEGWAEGTEVFSGGVQAVSSGGHAAGTVVNGGAVNVFSGGVLSGAEITSGTVTASAADVLSGSFSLGVGGTLDIQSNNQTIAGLAGSGLVAIDSGGTLTLEQNTDTVYSGQISGANGGGGFVKSLSGTLTLTHSDNVVEQLVVSGGGVILGSSGGNAGLTGDASVYDGGWLGGYGTLTGDATINSGGVLAAGNAYIDPTGGDYGGLTVSGDVAVSEGGIYLVRVGHEGAPTDADVITVTGGASFASGSIVRHVTGGIDTRVADPSSQWTILTTGGGVWGDLDDIEVQSNLLFLAPVLGVSGNDLLISFERIFAFSDFGSTPNQIAVAGGLDSLNPSGSLASTLLAGITDGTDVNRLYDQLSGEVHRSLAGGLMLADRDFSHWILRRSARGSLAGTILSSSAPSFSGSVPASIPARDPDPGRNALWVVPGYARQSLDGDGNAGGFTLKGPEVSLGYDFSAPSGWLGGFGFRYADREMRVGSRLSEADTDSFSFALHGGYQSSFGPGVGRLTLGGVYTRHEIETLRRIDSGLVQQRLSADYGADSHQLFLEGAYAFPAGAVWLEPFVGLDWMSMRVSGFSEKGGNAVLRVSSQSQSNLSQLVGLRLVLPSLGRVDFEAQAGWRHTYGGLAKASAFSFVDGGGVFDIRGVSLNRDEAVLDFRAAYQVRDNLRLGLELNAASGNRGSSVRGEAFLAIEW